MTGLPEVFRKVLFDMIELYFIKFMESKLDIWSNYATIKMESKLSVERWNYEESA